MSNKLPFTITHQGGPIVNDAWIYSQSPKRGIILAEVDLSTKHAVTCGDGDTDSGPIVMIGSNEGTVHLAPGKENDLTELVFRTLSGWHIWCAHISRYTLRICFVRNS